MIEKGAKNLTSCLYEACHKGYVNTAKLIIEMPGIPCSGFDYLTIMYYNNQETEKTERLANMLNTKYLNSILSAACEGGNVELIELVIEKGATDFEHGLYGACFGGNIEIINLMIAHGATDWNSGLYAACLGGHVEIIEMMIKKGATDFNNALIGACYGKQFGAAKLMIEKGANNFDRCRHLFSNVSGLIEYIDARKKSQST